MSKPHDWSDAARSPFGLLGDAWARAARDQRAPAPRAPLSLAPRPAWSALAGLLVTWFMPRR